MHGPIAPIYRQESGETAIIPCGQPPEGVYAVVFGYISLEIVPVGDVTEGLFYDKSEAIHFKYLPLDNQIINILTIPTNLS